MGYDDTVRNVRDYTNSSGNQQYQSKQENGYLDAAIALWDYYDTRKRNKKQDKMMEDAMKPTEYTRRPDLLDPNVQKNREYELANIDEREGAKLFGGLGYDFMEHFGGGQRRVEEDGRIMYTPSKGAFATPDRLAKWKQLFADYAMAGTPDKPRVRPGLTGASGDGAGRTGPHTPDTAGDAWTTPDGQTWDAPIVKGDNLDPAAWDYDQKGLVDFIAGGGAGPNQGFTGDGDNWFGTGGAIAEGRAMSPDGEVDVRMNGGKPVFKQDKPRWSGGEPAGTEPARDSGFDSFGDTLRDAAHRDPGQYDIFKSTMFQPFYNENGTWDLPINKDGDRINLSGNVDADLDALASGDTTGAKIRNGALALAAAAVKFGGGPVGMLAIKLLEGGAKRGLWGWDKKTGKPYWGNNPGEG